MEWVPSPSTVEILEVLWTGKTDSLKETWSSRQGVAWTSTVVTAISWLNRSPLEAEHHLRCCNFINIAFQFCDARNAAATTSTSRLWELSVNLLRQITLQESQSLTHRFGLGHRTCENIDSFWMLLVAGSSRWIGGYVDFRCQIWWQIYQYLQYKEICNLFTV